MPEHYWHPARGEWIPKEKKSLRTRLMERLYRIWGWLI